MTIQWSLFAPGLLLLLLPADRLLSAKVELRSFDSFQTLHQSPRFRPWWWVPVLWVDPLRGLAGTLLLKNALSIGSVDALLAANPAFWLMSGILVGAVACQMICRRAPDVLLAPIGFMMGVVFALAPWPVALIGVATGMVALFGLRRFDAFFSAALPGVILSGLALEAGMMGLAPALAALSLPIIAAFLTRSTFELPARNDSGPLPELRC